MKPAILITALALSSMPLRAQACAGPPLVGISGLHVRAVSADGHVFVGNLTYRAVRMTASGGILDLGHLGGGRARAFGVSADGSTVVGWATPANGADRAFRWTAAAGMQDLGTLGSGPSTALAANSDGSVVVGWSWTSSGDHAFRWTAAAGMQDLGVPTGGHQIRATGVSADGTVVVGYYSVPPFGVTRAFRWTAAGGIQDLGLPLSSATAVSEDGGVVVGTAGRDAFRWTVLGGYQVLGSAGADSSSASGVSADGSVIVGWSMVGFSRRAIRWTAIGGAQDLGTFGFADSYATGVSSDGSVVVGRAETPWGSSDGFRVHSSVMGTTYCRPTVENSTGCGAIVLANGDPRLATGALDLTATLLPMNSFGFFLTSQAQDLVVAAGGSQGNLCLGGNIGRFVGPGQVMDSGASGSFAMTVNLNAMPAPTLTGTTAVQPGETWNFQAWHRDANPTLTSNFTDAVSIQFQ